MSSKLSYQSSLGNEISLIRKKVIWSVSKDDNHVQKSTLLIVCYKEFLYQITKSLICWKRQKKKKKNKNKKNKTKYAVLRRPSDLTSSVGEEARARNMPTVL